MFAIIDNEQNGLITQLSTFIGRESEIVEITHLLATNRLLTLAGVGGIGKTRLALQVGQKLLKKLPGWGMGYYS